MLNQNTVKIDSGRKYFRGFICKKNQKKNES
jgi:hypothetical protein